MAQREGKARRPIGREPSLGEALREAIEKSGLPVSEIARRSEVARSQLLRFLSGERDLRLETAGYLCRVLGLSLCEVSRGRGRPKQQKTDRPGISINGLKAGLITTDDASETDRSGNQEF